MTLPDDPIKKALAAQEAWLKHDELLSSLGSPLTTRLNEIESLLANSSLRRMLDDMTRHQDAVRAALGPLADLRHSDLFGTNAAITEQLERAQRTAEEFNARFRLPAQIEFPSLLEQFKANSPLARAMEDAERHTRQIEEAMKVIRTPWLDMQDQVKSIAGFAELQTVGLALKNFHAFDERLTDSLRFDLGDWRSITKWPDAIFDDAVARSAFYAEHGFNTRLTLFPPEAFEQSVEIAGLRDTPPPLLKRFQGDDEAHVDEEEAGFRRTNEAHDRLMRLETHIRHFIDDRMRDMFGDQWITHRVPGDLSKKWREKQQIAREKGDGDHPLIAYADFTDYLPVITQRNNWNDVFEPVFRRKESVTESFYRLFPLRLSAMHARIITQDDEIYLYVEVKRLLRAIGVEI